jgi:hypothetical protein
VSWRTSCDGRGRLDRVASTASCSRSARSSSMRSGRGVNSYRTRRKTRVEKDPHARHGPRSNQCGSSRCDRRGDLQVRVAVCGEFMAFERTCRWRSVPSAMCAEAARGECHVAVPSVLGRGPMCWIDGSLRTAARIGCQAVRGCQSNGVALGWGRSARRCNHLGPLRSANCRQR